MHSKHRPHKPSILLSKLALMSGLLLIAPVQAEQKSPQALQLDIPRQQLISALTEFAEQTGLQLLYSADLAENLTGRPLKGRYTPNEALKTLLEGSGIQYRYVDDNVITLEWPNKSTLSTESLLAASPMEKFMYAAEEPENTGTDGPVEQMDMTVQGMEVGYSVLNASTATKTDTPIMETPFSIQVVPRQLMDDVQAIRPNDALDYVSGIFRASGSGDFLENSRRRGFSGEDYRDGVPFRLSGYNTGGRDLANTERVEVMKGPASLLYGMTQPGGVVNYVMKKPLATPYYSLQQQFGSFDLYRTTLDTTGPITNDDTLLYRFNLAYKSADSFRDFVDSERTFIAPVLTWNLSPRTQVSLEMEYDTGHVVFDPGIVAVGDRPADLPRSRFLGVPSPYEFENILAGLNWTHAFNDYWKISYRFNAQFKGQNGRTGSAGSVAADGTASRFSLLQFQDPGDSRIYFNSLNLTGHFSTFGLDHTVLFGGDYYDYSIDTTQNVLSPSINIYNPVYLSAAEVRGNPANDVQLHNRQNWFGLYFQDQIKLPYHFNMLAGFRYDSAEYHGLNGTRKTDQPRQDYLSPRGGLVWQPLPELSVYGSYTENFTAIKATGFGGNLLAPETAQQWEVGLKTELFDQRFLGTLAWFDLTKQNVAQSDPLHPGFVIPVGEIRTAGLELDLKGELLPGWNLIAAYAYTPDAEVTVGTNASQVGRRLNGIPEHGGSFFTTYEMQSGSLQGLKFGGGVIVRSSQETDLNANSISLPGYATVNLLASYGLKVGKSKLTAQLNVNNLLDKNYYPSAFNHNRIEVGTPRSFMGSIRIEY